MHVTFNLTDPTVLTTPSSNVLAVEDPQGFLQGLNFFLSSVHTIFIAHTCIDARWFQLVEISKGGIKLLLSSLQVFSLHGQCLGFVLLLCSLVLNICRLLCLIHLGIRHESVICLLS